MAVLGRSRSGGPPLDQILDPPLYNNHLWLHVSFTNEMYFSEKNRCLQTS